MVGTNPPLTLQRKTCGDVIDDSGINLGSSLVDYDGRVHSSVPSLKRIPCLAILEAGGTELFVLQASPLPKPHL